jgi:hypothetical protein
VPLIPREERFEVLAPTPAPELMRLRIISVAALNWGTYFGGDSFMGVSLDVEGAGVLGLGGCDAIVKVEGP